jgi:hypothetical protein
LTLAAARPRSELFVGQSIGCKRSGDSTISDDTGSRNRSQPLRKFDAVKDAAHRIGDAIDASRKPGMPLSILSNVVRKHSWIAFWRFRWARQWLGAGEGLKLHGHEALMLCA